MDLGLSALDALALGEAVPAVDADVAVSYRTPLHGTQGTFTGGLEVVVFLEVLPLLKRERWASSF